eukprot:jgi/Bigna1/47740/estExt_Genewise1.C_170143
MSTESGQSVQNVLIFQICCAYLVIALQLLWCWKHRRGRRTGRRCRAAVQSVKGRRPYMEDAFVCLPKLSATMVGRLAFFGVYDGHGGDKASNYLSRYLHVLVLSSVRFPSEPVAALMEAFQKIEESWSQIALVSKLRDGSTASVVMILKGTLYVANLGDSRVVLSSQGEALPLTKDHKPNDPDERKRIESLGGFVNHRRGTFRLNNVLSTSRAIGNLSLKPYVSSVPDVVRRKISQEDNFLIVASDGLWDVISSQDAVDICARQRNVKEASVALVEEAISRSGQDNITAIVVALQDYAYQ